MKKVLFCLFLSLSFLSKAQKVELGADIGGIEQISIGLSTWKWLYIGGSFHDYNFWRGDNVLYKSKEYRFCTPTFFLQPTINVNRKINVYGAYHYGWFVDNYLGGENGSDRAYIIDFGVNYKILKKLFLNCELGYIHSIINGYSFTYDIPNFNIDHKYICVGIRYFPKRKEKKPGI